MNTTDYFAFLRERYAILLRRRAGESWPWTEDPVLRAWRFTNVRREDDRTTIAFRETVREPISDDPHVLLATIAWRWFNLIETGEILRPFLMSKDAWDRAEVERLLQERHDSGKPIFTGAFMVNSPQNRPKLPAILDCIDWCYENLDPEAILRECRTKEAMFERIKAVPRQGPFSAYQVVVDLMYTLYLEDASDLGSFTVAGPGCARGLGYVVHDRPDAFGYQSRHGQRVMLEHMCGLLAASRDHWPADWPPFILSDIENGCCEYAKYRSAREGKRQKRRYPPAA
jgi:hypothetical protein